MKRILYILILMMLLTVVPGISVKGATDFSYALKESRSSQEVVRIGFDPTLPPYQYKEKGIYKGFLLELSEMIFDELSMKIELIPMPLSESIKEVDKGNVDMILGLRYNAALSDKMIFSDSLVNSTISIVVSNDSVERVKQSQGIEPLLIAVERDSAEFEYVKNIKKANFNNAFNQESVVELLLMNRADMLIGVRHVVEHILEKNKLMEAYTFSNSYETPVDYYLAMRQGEERLLSQVNVMIRQLKLNGEYETLYNRWINDKNLERQKRIEFYLKLFGGIIVLAAVTIVISVLLSISLKKRVDEKTRELVVINKQLENKIVEIENTTELKNLIFESSPRSIAIIDGLGNISAMNNHAAKICGLSEIPIGESVFELFPLNVMVKAHFDKVLKLGEFHAEQAFEVTQGDRKNFYRYVIYPLMDAKGVILTIEDSTEEIILKEQLFEKEKNIALMRIISGIAHEIRNPMTSIKTYAELLPRKKDNMEFQKQIAKVIPNEVERINRLIENLIDYTRPKQRIEVRMDIENFIESCILLFMPTLSKNDIGLTYSVEKDLEIVADKDQLKQVMINLILNAIDAILEKREQLMEENAYKVKIASYQDQGMAIIRVEDNGIGMTSEEISGIFELFYTTKLKGNGIGMPMSRQIVEDNHGTIGIESEKYSGTTITLKFKLDQQ